MDSVNNFWLFINSTLLPVLFPRDNAEEYKYSCYEPITRRRRALVTNGFLSDHVHFLLGARLRQVRMPVQECQVPDYVSDLFPNCVAEYNIALEDSESYKEGWRPVGEGESGDLGFMYDSFVKTKSSGDSFSLGFYGGGGYVADLGHDAETAYGFFKKLYRGNWIDRQTRAVFAEILVLNPATEYYTSISIPFEFYPIGGIIADVKIYTLMLNLFSGRQGALRLLLWIVILAFVIFFAVRESIAIYYQREKYFKVALLLMLFA